MTNKTRAIAKENGRSAFSVNIEVGAFTIHGDEPQEMGGAGGGPAPFDLLTAALAECTAMTVRWYARSKNIPLSRVCAEVVYEARKVADGQERAADFRKLISLEGDLLTDDDRRKLLEVAAKCPVQKVLERTAVITTEIESL